MSPNQTSALAYVAQVFSSLPQRAVGDLTGNRDLAELNTRKANPWPSQST
jgi:hypothetical protein